LRGMRRVEVTGTEEEGSGSEAAWTAGVALWAALG